jgi:hypothetical protein
MSSDHHTTSSSESPLAARLMNYIRKRAAREGVYFDLPVSFFQKTIDNGIGIIFGVHHDGKVMLFDEQEPEAGFFSDNS